MAIKTLGASGVLYDERRQFYISPNVVKELWTDIAPFTTIVANRGVEKPQDPLFKMFEHRATWIKQQFAVNDAGPSPVPNDDTGVTVNYDGCTGLTADSSLIGLECEVWDSTLTTMKGKALITAFASATALTAKSLRPAAITLADNDVFLVIGNAHGEGASSPEAFSDELEIVYGSTQIFRTPVEITGTLLEAALRGYSNELARLRDLKNKEHKYQKEKAFLFGGSLMTTGMSGTSFADNARTDVNSKKVRTTTGLVEALERYGYGKVGSAFTNTSTDETKINLFEINSSTYKYSNFVDDMELVFQFLPESGTKYALVGAGALSYWSKVEEAGFVGKSGWKIQIGDTKRDSLGFNIRTLETPHGVLQLIPTPAFRGPRKNQMLIVSDENLRHVQYRAPMFRANIKTDNAPDLVKDEYFSDEGVGVSLIESHKLFNILVS